MKKEYKGWEIAKMICEGELKDGDLLIRDDIKNKTFKVVSKHLELINSDRELGSSFLGSCDGLYQIIEKPVSFMEVVNSKEDCRVEHSILDIVVATEEDNSWWKEFNNKEYLPLNCLLHILSGNLGVREVKEVILEGKWYIEN